MHEKIIQTIRNWGNFFLNVLQFFFFLLFVNKYLCIFPIQRSGIYCSWSVFTKKTHYYFYEVCRKRKMHIVLSNFASILGVKKKKTFEIAFRNPDEIFFETKKSSCEKIPWKHSMKIPQNLREFFKISIISSKIPAEIFKINTEI